MAELSAIPGTARQCAPDEYERPLPFLGLARWKAEEKERAIREARKRIHVVKKGDLE